METYLVVLVALVSVATGAHVRQLSPCKAVVNGNLYNLESLRRIDGHPRYQVEKGHGNWNYSFNPCQSFNLPVDPHEGNGDQCHYVAVCQWSKEGKYYSLGLQRNARFILHRRLSTRTFHQQLPVPEKLNGRNQVNDRHSTNQRSSSVDLEDDWTETSSTKFEPENLKTIPLQERSNQSSGKNLTMDESGNIAGDADNTWNEKVVSETRPMEVVTTGGTEYHSTSTTHQRIPAIVFKGIRTKVKRRVVIDLICDHERVLADDGLLRLINDSSDDKHFELHHKCCCPNACIEESLPGHSLGGEENHVTGLDPTRRTTLNISTWDGSMGQLDPGMPSPQSSQLGGGNKGGGVVSGIPVDKRPRYIWLILVINGSILAIAIFVAGFCCRKGGMSFVSTGVYGYVPAGVHSSRLTIDSTDIDCRYVTTIKSMTSPDYRDYGSSAQMSRAPVTDNALVPSHQIDLGQRLGGGLFSDTYLAEWKKLRVAVKRITVRVHQTQLTDADTAWIATEVSRLTHQRHRNLVAVLGVCIETRQPYVINELIEGDSLKEKIVRMEIEQFNWYQRLKLCLQTTDGMAYLHSAKTPVLHRDLRSANILIDQYGKAKIVDFGLTRIIQRLRSECEHGTGCYCQKERSAFPASVRWTAPEVMRNPTAEESDEEAFSTACDVYSFAMVCWEIASYRDPFDDATEEQVMEFVQQGARPPIDSLQTVIGPFRELTKACWAQNPESRPTFKQISVTLKSIQQLGGRFSSQIKRKRTNSESTNYLRSALNVSDL